MPWAFLDDRANENEKLLAVGGAAAWYWACGLMYCRRKENERRQRGERVDFIPAAQAPALFADPKARQHVKALVRERLWHQVEGGYAVNDYGKVYGKSGQPPTPAEPDQPASPARNQPNPVSQLGGLARAKSASRGPAGTFLPAGSLDQPRARPDPDPVDLPEKTTTKDLTGSGTSRGDGGGSQMVECPSDLELSDEQKAQFHQHAMVDWYGHAIKVITSAFVGSARADLTDKRTLIVWRKCLYKACVSSWNDPKKQPKPPAETPADRDDTGGFGKSEEWGAAS